MRAARAHLATDTHTHRAFFLYAFAAFIPLGVVVVGENKKKKQTNVRNSASVFEGYARRAHNAWPLIWTKSILWKKKRKHRSKQCTSYVWWWCESAHARHFTVAWQQCNPTHPPKSKQMSKQMKLVISQRHGVGWRSLTSMCAFILFVKFHSLSLSYSLCWCVMRFGRLIS